MLTDDLEPILLLERHQHLFNDTTSGANIDIGLSSDIRLIERHDDFTRDLARIGIHVGFELRHVAAAGAPEHWVEAGVCGGAVIRRIPGVIPEEALGQG
jgi:hypothetical protein